MLGAKAAYEMKITTQPNCKQGELTGKKIPSSVLAKMEYKIWKINSIVVSEIYDDAFRIADILKLYLLFYEKFQTHKTVYTLYSNL